jgi:monoamine oxidase
MLAPRGLVDVAIVGGGAAGIAAACRLLAIGRSVLLIEALPRIGGRAHTVELEGMRLDLGCGWLHSAERNPFMRMAEMFGLRIDRSEGAWDRQLDDLTFPAGEQREAWGAYRAFKQRLQLAPPASDCAADALDPDCRWRPFIDGVSSFVAGTELANVSAADLAAYNRAAGPRDWRLQDGYGALIASLGSKIATSLSTSVSEVRQDDDIVIETNHGTVRARAAIVAVSTAVLARGDIRFDPAALDQLHAAACLPLGLANKVLLALDDPDAVPVESHLLGNPYRAGTGSYYFRPLGHPVIEGFFGGSLAAELEADGPVAAEAFCREELTALLGADFAAQLRPLAITRWGQEPTIGGSYSYAIPGEAHQRDILALPVSDRLCFAGEACSVGDFSTAHGAWQSGIAAANRVDLSLPSIRAMS